MKTNVHIKLLYCISIIPMLLQSCDYKSLDDSIYPEDWSLQSVEISWDYSHIDSVPKAFRVAFYPSDEDTKKKVGQSCLLFDVYSSHSMQSNIPSGQYDVTAWNTDTEHCVVSDESDRKALNASTLTSYTSGANPSKVLDSLYYGQKIYDTPEYMVHANKEKVTFKTDVENQSVTLTPDSMCITVEYRIHGVSSLGLSKQIRAAMNNVTYKRYIASELSTSDTCVVMTDCLTNANDSTIYGKFYLFGMEPQDFQLMDHTMTLFFWLENRNIYFPVRINPYLMPYTRNDNFIRLDIPSVGLNLADYAQSVESFDINVSDWEDVPIDISW